MKVFKKYFQFKVSQAKDVEPMDIEGRLYVCHLQSYWIDMFQLFRKNVCIIIYICILIYKYEQNMVFAIFLKAYSPVVEYEH
jgi:hypothetical protein